MNPSAIGGGGFFGTSSNKYYMQRYMAHFPAAGEIVIFDRSWYNRAGVEYVMGFCTPKQHRRFLDLCPEVEKYLVDGGIILIKFWLEVSDREQKRRFEARITDPVRQWKLSPIDLPSRSKWFECSRARDMMLKATDTEWAPWYLIRSDDKKRARLNCITHLLKLLQVSLTIKSTAPKTSHLSIVVSFKGCQLLRGGLLESHH